MCEIKRLKFFSAYDNLKITGHKAENGKQDRKKDLLGSFCKYTIIHYLAAQNEPRLAVPSCQW